MQPLAEGAVGNLIVILQIADERHAGQIERRRPTRLLLPPVPLPLVRVPYFAIETNSWGDPV